jgi:hypothetical protein
MINVQDNGKFIRERYASWVRLAHVVNPVQVSLLALFTLVILVITFYFPLCGLGLVLDRSAALSDRWEGQ